MPKTTPCFWIRRPSRCCLEQNLDFAIVRRLDVHWFIKFKLCAVLWMDGNWILCSFFFESWNLLSVCVFFGETSGRASASGFHCSLWIDFLLSSFQKSLPSLYPRNSVAGRCWQRWRRAVHRRLIGWLVVLVSWLVDASWFLGKKIVCLIGARIRNEAWRTGDAPRCIHEEFDLFVEDSGSKQKKLVIQDQLFSRLLKKAILKHVPLESWAVLCYTSPWLFSFWIKMIIFRWSNKIHPTFFF